MMNIEIAKAMALSDYAKERKIAYNQVPVIGRPFKHPLPDRKPSASNPGIEKDCIHQKMILLGDKDVGKTSILMRYIYHDQQKSGASASKKSSSSAGFIVSRFVEAEDAIKHYNMWDISYRGGFIQNIKEYYDRANVACVIFDVTKPETFAECKTWAMEMDSIVSKVVIVANKIDLVDQRKVMKDEASDFANQHGFLYHEVSAAQNGGMDELFRDLESDKAAILEPKAAKKDAKDKGKQGKSGKGSQGKSKQQNDKSKQGPLKKQKTQAEPKAESTRSILSPEQEELRLELAFTNFECNVRMPKD